jgi:hypothetical protein
MSNAIVGGSSNMEKKNLIRISQIAKNDAPDTGTDLEGFVDDNGV